MSSIQNHCKAFLNWLPVVLNWLPVVLNWLPGEPEPQQIDPESPPIQQPEQVDPESPPVRQQAGLKIEGWAKIIICLCFASAIQIALVSVQLHSHLLPIFHSLSLCILFGFASLVINIVINTKFPNTARVFGAASVFFVVTAFFIAISILFPLYLKLTVLVVYAVCLIIVILTLYSSYRS